MDESGRRSRSEWISQQVTRGPDYFDDDGTPVWELPDGSTVYGEGRRRRVWLPPKYVYVPPEEWETTEKKLVDLLANILMDALRRDAREKHASSPSASDEDADAEGN